MFSAGAAAGPIVGGILLEHFAWGSVFLLAVPVLLPLLVFAPLLVPESRDPCPGRIDPISIVCKVTSVDGRPAVKLSDNPEKATGIPSEVERYLRVFGNVGRVRTAVHV